VYDGLEQWPEVIDFVRDAQAELKSGTDRGVVLVCAAIIDDLLGRLILSFLVEDRISSELMDPRRDTPLSSFSSRINAAFALGLITREERRDLHTVREIRNDFAHKLGPSFQSNALKDKCDTLRSRITFRNPGSRPPREVFTMATINFVANFAVRRDYFKKTRRTLLTEEFLDSLTKEL
jgi:mannitol operon repressor